MKKGERTTGLFEELASADMKNGFKDYVKQHPTEKSVQSFSEYINDYISSHEDIPVNFIAKSCGFGADYARDIMRGKKNGSRDRILAICISAKMNLKETRRALKTAQCGDLYPKIPRDMALIICINNECFDVAKVNLYLEDNDCEMLQLERVFKSRKSK